MNKVVGSRQYRSVVVEDRPGRRLAVAAAAVAVVALSLAIAYWAGGYALRGEYRQLQSDHQTLQQELEQARSKLEETSQALTNLQLGSEVDRQAVEQVRETMRGDQETIAKLNEEISFYKGLMAPTERERGLGIRGWELYPGAEPNRFQYRLIVQQLALKHTLLVGSVSVTLVGREQGVERSYPLSALSEQVNDTNIKLRFKYFQNFEGELQLPEGFVVDRVDIVARASKPNAVEVEKHFGWIVQIAGL